MNPYNEEEEEKITTHLVLGMYHTIKTAHKMVNETSGYETQKINVLERILENMSYSKSGH